MINIRRNDIHLDIGTRIREIRTELGLAIRELAGKVGISYVTMQRIETDKISPPVTLPSVTDLLLLYPLVPIFQFRKNWRRSRCMLDGKEPVSGRPWRPIFHTIVEEVDDARGVPLKN